eukprot:GHVU01232427.1.p2 GENE.GHVU01232427.1~~GHVU01232427.1.p2  ORF type:complete len:100 (-),score=1.56 GHVU01232427.1:826-1125(-)
MPLGYHSHDAEQKIQPPQLAAYLPGIGVMLLSYSAAGASDSFFLVSPFFPAPFFAGLSSFPFFSSASGLSAPFLAGFGAILLTAGKKLSHYMYLAAKCS